MNRTVILLLCAAFGAGWYFQGLRWDRDAYRIEKEAAEKGAEILSEALIYQRIAESHAAQIDLQSTVKLNEERKKNQILANAVASGERRLRIAGECKQTTATGSVGNDATVELSPGAGRNIFTVRDGIIEDRAKIGYLQNYIHAFCRTK